MVGWRVQIKHGIIVVQLWGLLIKNSIEAMQLSSQMGRVALHASGAFTIATSQLDKKFAHHHHRVGDNTWRFA